MQPTKRFQAACQNQVMQRLLTLLYETEEIISDLVS